MSSRALFDVLTYWLFPLPVAVSWVLFVHTAWKLSKYGIFLVRFSRIRTEYGVSLRIQSERGKKRTRKKLRIWTLFTQWHLCKLLFIYSANTSLISLCRNITKPPILHESEWCRFWLDLHAHIAGRFGNT